MTPDISKATPRPWRYVNQPTHINICGTPGGIIAKINIRLDGRFLTRTTDTANAALIVRAVNEYEALNTVTKLAAQLQYNCECVGPNDNCPYCMLRNALAALETLRKGNQP